MSDIRDQVAELVGQLGSVTPDQALAVNALSQPIFVMAANGKPAISLDWLLKLIPIVIQLITTGTLTPAVIQAILNLISDLWLRPQSSSPSP